MDKYTSFIKMCVHSAREKRKPNICSPSKIKMRDIFYKDVLYHKNKDLLK